MILFNVYCLHVGIWNFVGMCTMNVPTDCARNTTCKPKIKKCGGGVNIWVCDQ